MKQSMRWVPTHPEPRSKYGAETSSRPGGRSTTRCVCSDPASPVLRMKTVTSTGCPCGIAVADATSDTPRFGVELPPPPPPGGLGGCGVVVVDGVVVVEVVVVVVVVVETGGVGVKR